MARGLFDFGTGNGLFGPQRSGTADALQTGFAALADAGNAFSGRPQQVGQLQQIAQQRQQQDMQRQLIAGLTSPDPAIRQRAEVFAATNGVNVDQIKAALGQRKPQYQEVGNTLVEIPGDGGAPKPVYTAPKEFKMPQTRSYEQGQETITEQFNPADGTFTPLARAPRYKPSSGGAPAGPGIGVGKTIAERMQSILLNGDPTSPQYAAAYGYLSQPKVSIDGATGQPVTIRADLSWARPPVRGDKPAPAPQPTINIGEPVKPAELTQEMKTAAGFADRMENSGKIITGSGGALANPGDRALDSLPLGNYLVGDTFQGANQAKRDWINAQLRRESGAVISPGEFANADKQYFPVPGDSEATIAQKARNRQIAEQAMRRSGTAPRAPVTDGSQQQAPAGRVIKYDAQGNRI
jgi:hypothetical protein